MDRALTRLVNLNWYVYRRPEIAVGILKQIVEDIHNLIHNRIIRTWGILTRTPLRRSQSAPNFMTPPPQVH